LKVAGEKILLCSSPANLRPLLLPATSRCPESGSRHRFRRLLVRRPNQALPVMRHRLLLHKHKFLPPRHHRRHQNRRPLFRQQHHRRHHHKQHHLCLTRQLKSVAPWFNHPARAVRQCLLCQNRQPRRRPKRPPLNRDNHWPRQQQLHPNRSALHNRQPAGRPPVNRPYKIARVYQFSPERRRLSASALHPLPCSLVSLLLRGYLKGRKLAVRHSLLESKRQVFLPSQHRKWCLVLAIRSPRQHRLCHQAESQTKFPMPSIASIPLSN